jgi:hypothetical protein
MHRLSISIIIDNYNYADYVEDAIKSALAQDYSPREIIVVDDGSTDASRDVLEKYARDGRIRCVFKPNGGQGSAFNAGFAVSTGDVICLLDADDLWLPDKVRHVVHTAARHPRASVICHPVQCVSGDGRPQGQPKPGRISTGTIKRKVIASGGYWRWPPTSGLSFRRSFLEQVLPMPEAEFRTCADAYLATLAPLLGDVASFSEPAALYRIHGTNHWASDNAARAPASRVAGETRRLEVLVTQVNRTLTSLGRPDRLTLSDHLPYRMLRRTSGGNETLWSLMLYALRWPGDVPPVRLKMLTSNLSTMYRATPALSV